jgi:ligand-binding SRPBCC domain-containing protein
LLLNPVPHTYTLTRTQFIPRPRDEVFAFFARPENLQSLTPAFLHFAFLTPSPIPMHPGARIDYRLRLWGVPVRWATQIERFEPPYLFTDIQLRGPYRRWHHTHEFHEAEGGTEMRDRVEYEMPLGPVGLLAHRLFVRRSVEEIFAFRQQKVAELWPEIATRPDLPPAARNPGASCSR